MADASLPVNTSGSSLSDASSAAAVAPNSLSGWAALQREINTVIPMRLHEMDRLLAQTDQVLAGIGG